jgi:hypothetical protein
MQEDFNFELSKLNFKAKNLASSMRIQDPFSSSHSLFQLDLDIHNQKQEELQQLIEDDMEQPPNLSFASSMITDDFSELDTNHTSDQLSECFRTNLKLQIDEFGNVDDRMRLITLLVINLFLVKNVTEINQRLAASDVESGEKGTVELDFC